MYDVEYRGVLAIHLPIIGVLVKRGTYAGSAQVKKMVFHFVTCFKITVEGFGFHAMKLCSPRGNLFTRISCLIPVQGIHMPARGKIALA
ncbi:hypothetical protein COR50_16670 [Chitinophaga caeni]|uniref:Uncharacterized protein n=1 Tax=Chitinophaga caeni TaxID=2029983 RepID=A0A291QXJ5_9BACT|nr:hypothetical protein COR50_16670 [Chitinophaga caeni]